MVNGGVAAWTHLMRFKLSPLGAVFALMNGAVETPAPLPHLCRAMVPPSRQKCSSLARGLARSQSRNDWPERTIDLINQAHSRI